jgi:outer membrane biosynthesis protein TonB
MVAHMRTDVKVAAIAFGVLLVACSDTRQEQTTGLSEDLKRDLAAAAAPGDLATAPRSYERTRFVSDIELSRTTKSPTPKMVATKRRTKPVRRAEAVSRPAPDVVEEPTVASDEAMSPAPAPAPAPTTEPEPTVIAQQPAEPSAPASAPTAGRGDDGRSVGQGGIGERARGGGLGGVLGGIIGAVVIRGGHGGIDHCDPRVDARRRGRMGGPGGMGGVLVERPGGLPLPGGRPTFPTRL